MVPVPVKTKQIPNMGNSTARPVNKLVFYTQRIEEKFHGFRIALADRHAVKQGILDGIPGISRIVGSV